jgi:hypothetical protein
MDSTVHIWHIRQTAGPALIGSSGGATTAAAPDGEAPAAVASTSASAGAAAKGASKAGPVGEAVETQQIKQAGSQGRDEEEDEDEDEYEEDEGPPVVVLQGADGTTIEMVELTCGGYSGKVRACVCEGVCVVVCVRCALLRVRWIQRVAWYQPPICAHLPTAASHVILCPPGAARRVWHRPRRRPAAGQLRRHQLPRLGLL